MTRRNRAAVLLLAAIVTVSALTLTLMSPTVRGEDEGVFEEYAASLAPLTQAIQFLLDHYHRPLDASALIKAALVGMLESLNDPYTVYYEPEEYEDLQVEIEGTYSGVGITISAQGEATVIQSVLPRTPADGSGLMPGDRIVQVDGKDVSGHSIEAIARLIRGPVDTEVSITVERASGELRTVRLVRAHVEREAIAVELFDGHIGYIHVIQFFEGASDQVADAYAYFREIGVNGLVLDLRNNPGGLLSEAINIARLFVPEGPVVHIVGAGGKTTTYNATGREPGPPLTVLVNGGSASASEIVAAAIQDSGAGVVIGSRTFGKGSVQSITRLRNGGALKFTTAEYLTPNRRSIEGQGVVPDVTIGLEPDEPERWLPLTGRHVLQRGSRGLEVEGLQQRLNRLGYDVGVVDGIFGRRTEAAVQAFQAEHGLPATGRFNYKTYERLAAAVAAAVAGRWPAGTDAVLERALELLRSGQVPRAVTSSMDETSAARGSGAAEAVGAGAAADGGTR